jgi:hypothetical protein
MALSADKIRDHNGGGTTFEVPVAASALIYHGALVCFDTAGRAVAAADTSGYAIAGVAEKQADNSSGSAGAIDCIVRRGQVEKFATSVLVLADVGKNAQVADDATLTDAAAASNDVAVGTIVKFETGFVHVQVGVLAESDA